MDLSTVHDFNHLTNHTKFTQRRQWQPAKSLQSCPTLCDPTDGSPPGSPVPGILQARTLEWVAISFSNAWKWKVKVKSLSRVQILASPWTAAYQAPPSMGFFQARVLEWVAIAFSLAAAAVAKFTMVYILYYTIVYYTILYILFYCTISYHTRLFYSMANVFLPTKIINLIPI